jgi:predicted nuclease with TOPRIM domain
MARNRKSQSAAIRFGPLVKAFLLCLLIGGSGIGYVWQKDQIGRLGRHQKEREKMLDRLKDQNSKLREQFAIMRRPQALEERIKELKLGLGPPQPAQVWRLTEPTGQLARLDEERHYVARSEAALAGP